MFTNVPDDRKFSEKYLAKVLGIKQGLHNFPVISDNQAQLIGTMTGQ